VRRPSPVCPGQYGSGARFRVKGDGRRGPLIQAAGGRFSQLIVASTGQMCRVQPTPDFVSGLLGWRNDFCRVNASMLPHLRKRRHGKRISQGAQRGTRPLQPSEAIRARLAEGPPGTTSSNRRRRPGLDRGFARSPRATAGRRSPASTSRPHAPRQLPWRTPALHSRLTAQSRSSTFGVPSSPGPGQPRLHLWRPCCRAVQQRSALCLPEPGESSLLTSRSGTKFANLLPAAGEHHPVAPDDARAGRLRERLTTGGSTVSGTHDPYAP